MICDQGNSFLIINNITKKIYSLFNFTYLSTELQINILMRMEINIKRNFYVYANKR